MGPQTLLCHKLLNCKELRFYNDLTLYTPWNVPHSVAIRLGRRTCPRTPVYFIHRQIIRQHTPTALSPCCEGQCDGGRTVLGFLTRLLTTTLGLCRPLRPLHDRMPVILDSLAEAVSL